MTDIKKISELDYIHTLTDNDEFVVVDKSLTTGTDASSGGKTSKVSLWQIKDAIKLSGTKGQKGEIGLVGEKGPVGEPGIPGSTGPEGTHGLPGAKGSKGQMGPAGPTGDPGPSGSKGDLGSKGSKGELGATGTKGERGISGNSNSHLSLSGTKVAMDTTGTAIRKYSASGWDATIFSKLSFEGPCYVTFSSASGRHGMMGLGDNPTSMSSYEKLNFAIYTTPTAVFAYESGKSVQKLLEEHNESDIFSIVYDTSTVKYYCNGELKRVVGVSNKKYKFHLDSSFYSYGTVITKFSFGPTGRIGETGLRGQKGERGSPGSPGNRGQAGSPGQKGESGASIKGQKGESGASIKGQKGVIGPKGPTGIGIKGQAGSSVKGQKGQAGSSIKGQKGATGASGSPWGGGTFGGDVKITKDLVVDGKITSNKPFANVTSIKNHKAFEFSARGRSAGTWQTKSWHYANQIPKSASFAIIMPIIGRDAFMNAKGIDVQSIFGGTWSSCFYCRTGNATSYVKEGSGFMANNFMIPIHTDGKLWLRFKHSAWPNYNWTPVLSFYIQGWI